VEKNAQRFISTQNFGLLGHIRFYEKYHANMQRVFVDKVADDLRLGNPWPELEKYFMDYKLDSCDEYEHKHIPFAVLLFQAIKKYGKLPAKSSEEKEFKEIVEKMKRFEGEDNVEEAVLYKKFAYKDTLDVTYCLSIY
jgi:amyloid beta precursor protein binding protein 1